MKGYITCRYCDKEVEVTDIVDKCENIIELYGWCNDCNKSVIETVSKS